MFRPFTSALLACVLVGLFVLLFVSAVDAAGDRAQQSQKNVGSSFDSCPKFPICSRGTTSLRLRLRYCQAITSRFLFGGGQRVRELPFATDANVRRDAIHALSDLLSSRVVGQPQVTSVLPGLLRRKLTYPGEPLVLHLAGDNGVGKTLTARLLSQALSLRCGEQDGNRQLCESGDALLTIAGTGLDGLSREAARRHIVWRVMQHMETYPHGVVLIDDLTAMDPDVVAGLAPLFGRAKYFPEQLDASLQQQQQAAAMASSEQTDAMGSSSPIGKQNALSNLLVIVTTDFGKQGRTVGKSPGEIEAMVRQEFTHLYGSLLPAYTRTFVYMPFTEQTAEGVVRAAVANLPCAMLWSHGTRIEASIIDDDAVSFLVQRSKSTWKGSENGHALRRLVEDELIIQVLAFLDQGGVDRTLRLHFVYDEAQSEVKLYTSGEHHSYGTDDL